MRSTHRSEQIHTTLDFTVYDSLRVAEDTKKWHNIVRMKVMEGRGHKSEMRSTTRGGILVYFIVLYQVSALGY